MTVSHSDLARECVCVACDGRRWGQPCLPATPPHRQAKRQLARTDSQPLGTDVALSSSSLSLSCLSLFASVVFPMVGSGNSSSSRPTRWTRRPCGRVASLRTVGASSDPLGLGWPPVPHLLPPSHLPHCLPFPTQPSLVLGEDCTPHFCKCLSDPTSLFLGDEIR